MSKHDKNDRAAARQDRNLLPETTGEELLDELEGAEELVKTSFAAGNEMKIAAAVIAVLVLVFAAVTIQWLRRSAEPAKTPEAEVVAKNEQPAASREKAKDKELPDRRDSSPFAPSAKSLKPTVVPAVPGSRTELKAKFGGTGPDNWNFASDAKTKGNTPDDRPSNASFQPRVASRGTSGSSGRSKSLDEPKRFLAGWQQDVDVRVPSGSSAPSDPFRDRMTTDTPRGATFSQATSAPSSANALTPAPQPPEPADSRRLAPGPFNRDTSQPNSSPPASRWNMPPSGSSAPSPPSFSSSPSTPSIPSSVPGSGVNSNPLRVGDGAAKAANSSSGLTVLPSGVRPSEMALPSTGGDLAGVRSPTPPATRPNARRTYVVQNGDTLYDIARQQLGKASRWREIYELNKDLINQRWLELEPGTQLILPDPEPEILTRRPGGNAVR